MGYSFSDSDLWRRIKEDLLYKEESFKFEIVETKLGFDSHSEIKTTKEYNFSKPVYDRQLIFNLANITDIYEQI